MVMGLGSPSIREGFRVVGFRAYGSGFRVQGCRIRAVGPSG